MQVTPQTFDKIGRRRGDMERMTPSWSIIFIGGGTALSITGLACAARALWLTHVAYGEGPLVPWFWHALSSVQSAMRRIFGQERPHGTQVFSASGSAMGTSSASLRAQLRVGFPSGQTQDQQIDHLVRAVEGIYRELTEEEGFANQRHSELSESVAKLASRVSDETSRLSGEDARIEVLARKAAAGGVRLQLVSIILIGAGTILATVPAIWALFAATP